MDGMSCDDLNEGELGNKWLIAAASTLALHPKLFAKVSQRSKVGPKQDTLFLKSVFKLSASQP